MMPCFRVGDQFLFFFIFLLNPLLSMKKGFIGCFNVRELG